MFHLSNSLSTKLPKYPEGKLDGHNNDMDPWIHGSLNPRILGSGSITVCGNQKWEKPKTKT